MISTLKTSSNGNFRLCHVSSIGMNNTPYEKLSVFSEDLADKYVIDIRLEENFDVQNYNGQPVKSTYNSVYIARGMRSNADSLAETEEYIEVLKEALEFAKIVKDFIESSDEWRAN